MTSSIPIIGLSEVAAQRLVDSGVLDPAPGFLPEGPATNRGLARFLGGGRHACPPGVRAPSRVADDAAAGRHRR